MIRTFLLVALAPTGLFWAWHLLASNGLWFSRDYHDAVFLLYSQLLGIEPDAVPFVFGRAVILDGAVVLAILAFRRRRQIVATIRLWFAPGPAQA